MFNPSSVLRFFVLSASVASLVAKEEQRSHLRNLIINGEKADPDRYPYYVETISAEGDPRCGGVLISNQVVLSAAHCAMPQADTFDIQGEVYSKLFEVIHPLYDSTKNANDIMFYVLDRPVPNAEYIQPYPYELSQALVGYNPMLVIGNGDTDPRSPTEYNDHYVPSKKLLKAEVFFVPDYECTAWIYAGAAMYQNVFNPENQLCAYNHEEGSCYGDSGGPLILEGASVSTDYLVGLVSYGFECDSYVPEVYTKISRFYYEIIQFLCYVDAVGIAEAPFYAICNGGFKSAQTKDGKTFVDSLLSDPLP